MMVDLATQNPRIAAYQACVACGYLDGDQTDEALAVLNQAAANGFAGIERDVAWFDAISVFARVAVELRAAGPAEHLVRLIEPYRDQLPNQGLTIHEPAASQLGGLLTVLGRFEEAEDHFNRAAELIEEGRLRFAQAQNDLAWGRVLLDRGRPSDPELGRAKIERARRTARKHGYRSVERRAEAALSGAES